MTVIAQDTVTRLHQLEKILRASGLSSDEVSLLAMHLAEIEEECAGYIQHIQSILAAGRYDSDALLRKLIDIRVSLEHMAFHIKGAEEELKRSLVVLDDDDESYIM
jgi:hypothetical protein